MPQTTSLRPLRPYQVAGIDWLKITGRALLADDMGLGKSRQLIEAAEGRTLVVAPAMVLAGGTWDDEIANWADDPELFTQVAYTDLSPREHRGRGYAPSMNLHEGLRLKWDTVIMDEAHYIKGRTNIEKKTKRPASTRAYLARKLAARADRLYLATGTPVPNWASEVFTLLQAIDPKAAKGGRELGNYWNWVNRWFRVKPNMFGSVYGGQVMGMLACGSECAQRSPWDPCQHYYDFVDANLLGRFLQRRRDDVLPDLPPLTRIEIETPMGKGQRRAYEQMKAEYIAEVGDETVVAWNAGSRNVKLDRITTGLDLIRPGASPAAAVADNSKLARLATDLENRSSPTVVMAHYTDSVEASAAVARSLGLRTATVHGKVSDGQRKARVRAFQAGEVDVLCGSLETLAEGLTLTQADMLIMLETSFKPYRNQQAERRIHRLGQTRPCTVLDYVTPGTVDRNKRALLRTKTDEAMRTLTAAQFKALL